MVRSGLALALSVCALAVVVRADEMSGDDKLRILYSHGFHFTKDGLPLLTVELMHGQKEVLVSAQGGLTVLPDGDGGSAVRAGSSYKVTAVGARPARMRFWSIVSRQATESDVATWKARGYATKTFETGVIFGVEGDVIDSRELFLGVAPEATEAAARRTAAALAEKWKIGTFLHPEMIERPRGTLVARDAGTGAVVENGGMLWFAPQGPGGAVTVKDVVHGGGGSQLQAEKRETRSYHGRIIVTQGQDGSLTVVNAVSEDELLAGLVPSEIFADAPPEALKAQAVAARDELLAKIGTRHFADPFVVCSTQHCQVYGGMGPEDPRTTRAVAATRGEVLLKPGGGLVDAYYSASCGGSGEHNENIWGTPADPTLRGHLDALGADLKALKKFARIDDGNVRAFLDAPPQASFCGRSKWAKGRFRWTVTHPGAFLDQLVGADFPEVGSLRELVPLERGVSGRIRRLELRGTRGKAVVEGDLRIRRLLGGLRSSLFVAHREGSSWIFEGAGFGHGVGMCQTGAIGMAESGHDYKRILEHYYPGSRIRKLY
jgi:stage II sporulation protein D